MVVGLGVRPSVCFSQILQSSDVIRSGNGVLALGKTLVRCCQVVVRVLKTLDDLGVSVLEQLGQFVLVLAQEIHNVVMVAGLRADVAKKCAVLVSLGNALEGRTAK